MSNDTTPQGAATPSDEEIMAWAMEHQTDAIKILRGSGFVRVARSVLARWGALQAAALPERMPLTPETIRQWFSRTNGLEDCDMCKIDDFTQVVRAVEARHNITSKAEGAQS